MWQFIYGSEASFAALEERAGNTCVRFSNQPLPPGSEPSRAMIGFEVDTVSETANLLVEHGINYTGPSAEIREWFDTGQRCFQNFFDLRFWIATTIRDAFGAVPSITEEQSGVEEALDHYGTTLELDEQEADALRIAMKQSCKRRDLPS